MLKLIFGVFQLAIFAAIVLVLGNFVKWHGHTISDEIKTRVSHAEQIFGETQTKPIPRAAVKTTRTNSSLRIEGEQISPSERQKLKALIQELNSSRSRD